MFSVRVRRLDTPGSSSQATSGGLETRLHAIWDAISLTLSVFNFSNLNDCVSIAVLISCEYFSKLLEVSGWLILAIC